MSERLPRVTEAELLRALARDGWYVARQGGHTILRHPTKRGSVPVPRHRGKTLKPGTLHDIIKLAGITPEEFRALL
jgi:predicted RNA binding protein YcfA (HicA-like mRNA interferase family)